MALGMIGLGASVRQPEGEGAIGADSPADLVAKLQAPRAAAKAAA
jgi:hypothetical protein